MKRCGGVPGLWTPAVHALLHHLGRAVFDGAPGARHGPVGPRSSLECSGREARASEPQAVTCGGLAEGAAAPLTEPTCRVELPRDLVEDGNSGRETIFCNNASRRGQTVFSVGA